MKQVLFVLTLILLLGGCASTVNTPTVSHAAQVAYEVLGHENSFIRADADFTQSNFASGGRVKEAAVFLSSNGDGREFGFFEMEDRAQVSKMLDALQQYLAQEKQVVEELANLYPADELQERLNRFEQATVGVSGLLVYYFLTAPSEADTIVHQLSR